MFTRFNGNVVPFADDATSTNRTVFGGTTQSDLIDDNLNTNFKKGWEIVGLNDNPTREDFNAMGYTLSALTAYLYEMGISEWNASQKYRTNSRTTGSDGKIYKSLTGTTGIPNVGNNPTTDAVNWVAEEAEKSVVYSALTVKTTPVDADLIAIADSTSSFSLKKLTWANLKDTLISSFGVMISTLTVKTTPVDADLIAIADSTSSFSSKKLSFSNLKENIVEVGTIRLVPISTAPTGYLEMNGALLSRTAYSKLFAYLGTTYGAGDGSTNFALPDTRGEFIRGWDNGRGVDGGRIIGSWQADLFKSHNHSAYTTTSIAGGAAGSGLGSPTSTSTGSTGGTETRPRNIAMMYCIKY